MFCCGFFFKYLSAASPCTAIPYAEPQQKNLRVLKVIGAGDVSRACASHCPCSGTRRTLINYCELVLCEASSRLAAGPRAPPAPPPQRDPRPPRRCANPAAAASPLLGPATAKGSARSEPSRAEPSAGAGSSRGAAPGSRRPQGGGEGKGAEHSTAPPPPAPLASSLPPFLPSPRRRARPHRTRPPSGPEPRLSAPMGDGRRPWLGAGRGGAAGCARPARGVRVRARGRRARGPGARPMHGASRSSEPSGLSPSSLPLSLPPLLPSQLSHSSLLRARHVLLRKTERFFQIPPTS